MQGVHFISRIQAKRFSEDFYLHTDVRSPVMEETIHAVDKTKVRANKGYSVVSKDVTRTRYCVNTLNQSPEWVLAWLREQEVLGWNSPLRYDEKGVSIKPIWAKDKV